MPRDEMWFEGRSAVAPKLRLSRNIGPVRRRIDWTFLVFWTIATPVSALSMWAFLDGLRRIAFP